MSDLYSAQKTEWGQKIIPDCEDDLTECKLIRSLERCQFGKNWNSYKEEIARNGDSAKGD
jgi:hypothetical protein